MTINKMKVITIATLVVAVAYQNAKALTVDAVKLFNTPPAGIEFTSHILNNTVVTNWVNSNGGSIQILESFREATLGWHVTKNTGIGTFTATGYTGSGDSAYKESYPSQDGSSIDTPHFFLYSQDYAGHWGRGSLDNDGGYFDSADVSEIKLELSPGLSNLAFFMTDASDVNADTILSVNSIDTLSRTSIRYKQGNGALWFVTIENIADPTIITWNTVKNSISYNPAAPSTWKVSTNDGWGADFFFTVLPIPEPATMLLFGTGLMAVAGILRRRIPAAQQPRVTG